MKLYLAPLQGYTEIEFRRAWSSLFTGIDVAVSPFIPLAESIRFRSAHLHDVIPSQNTRIPVIPQVLGIDQKYLFPLQQDLKTWDTKPLTGTWDAQKKGLPVKSAAQACCPILINLDKSWKSLSRNFPLNYPSKPVWATTQRMNFLNLSGCITIFLWIA